MVKANTLPVRIEVLPLKLVPSADEIDAMSRMEWRFQVIKARTEVGRALNQFFYCQEVK